MKVQVEGIIHNFSSKALNNSWADEIPNIIVRVINAISIAENKEELQTAPPAKCNIEVKIPLRTTC